MNCKVATIILNRNLANVTDKLCENIKIHSNTDIYVLEAGSSPNNISKFCTWHERSPEIVKHGLRYSRGLNYSCLKLQQENKWDKYDYIFFLTNDTVLPPVDSISKLITVMDKHPKVGILSPCSTRWGEKSLLKKQRTKYFWHIHNNAYLFRKDFLDNIAQTKNPSVNNFIMDGSNFRGYLAESELIAKGYVNDWAAAITTEVFAEENQEHLIHHSRLIETDSYEENLDEYIKEGLEWIEEKYGFKSHWAMHRYVKSTYDCFFSDHPELEEYRL